MEQQKNNEGEPKAIDTKEESAVALEQLLEKELEQRNTAEPSESPEAVQEKIDDLKRDLAYRQIMESRPDGSEPLTSEPLPQAPGIMTHADKPWWKKIAVTLGLAGAAATGSAAEANIPDTAATGMAVKEMKVTPERGLPELDMKKLEAAGVVRIDPVETSDTSKQVFLISLSKYKNYDDILQAIDKAGLKASSLETLREVTDRASEIAKKSRSIMSMERVTDKLGKVSFGFYTFDQKENRFHPENREIDIGIDSDWDQYRFIVELPNNTAQYQEGLAK